MSGRKLSAQEQKIHQAALADPKKTITQKECEALIPDASSRTAALNFLLATGLLKAMKDTKGAVSFRAVMKKELDVKKDMSGEESMILSYIQAAANEGIWTKHLKAKTELHQTVIDRCLKS
ncbi:RNA polymerase Rpc34 [Trametes gibbosa]|nr:RNA polymerase Rpc34 [Trametes gibbosa]